MRETSKIINNSLSKRKPGDIVFLSDFSGFGPDTAIRKCISRVAKEGRLRRIAHGIYYVPKTDPLLGEVYPSAEEVSRKIAENEKVLIHPTGSYAMNRLGLSTQVPMKVVYLTDGVSRTLAIGKTKVRFKATTRKKLAMKGEISRLVIYALDEMDLKHISPEQNSKLRALLKKEDPRKLKHDLSLAKGRVHDYIIKLLKEDTDERMVTTNS